MRRVTLRQAAQDLGVSQGTLDRWIAECGIEPLVDARTAIQRLSPLQVADLVRRYRLHLGLATIAPSTLARIEALLFGLASQPAVLLDHILTSLESCFRDAASSAPAAREPEPASGSLGPPHQAALGPTDTPDTRQAAWAAIKMVNRVANDVPRGPKSIVIVSQGPVSVFDRLPYLRKTWRDAVRRALDRGWEVRAVMRWPAEREYAMLAVEDILAWLGARGDYRLWTLRPIDETEEWREVVLVSGVEGVVVSAPASERYVAAERDDMRFRRLMLDAEGIQNLSVPALIPGLFEGHLFGQSVIFQSKIADLEDRPGRRGLVMDGLSDLLIPLGIQEDRVAPFRASRETGDRRQAEGTLDSHRKREDAFRRQSALSSIRDICTKGAIARLVEHGVPSPTDSLLAARCGPLSQPQRRLLLEELIRRITQVDGYEFGLLEDDQANDLHVDRAYWLVKEDNGVLIETWHGGDSGGRIQRNLEVTDALIAQGFYAFFDSRLWDRIHPWNKRKADVVEWLRLQVGRLP